MILDSNPGLFNCRGQLIDISKPLIMGILNITPDSFFDGGKYSSLEEQERRISEMISEGMDILDIGAYSSRPGATHISLDEEWRRLKPLLETISKKFDSQYISVDTFRSEIARRAVLDYGVSIINDISGGSMDEKMLDTLAELKVPYVLMHMKGKPQTMQDNPVYYNLMDEIIDFFIRKIEVLRRRGIYDIIIDPGFGFGKTIDQNYELLANLDQLHILDLPVLAGLSRKSMIYRFLDQEPSEALTGTVALQLVALQKGVKIIRSHDVKEAVICRKLVEKVSTSR